MEASQKLLEEEENLECIIVDAFESDLSAEAVAAALRFSQYFYLNSKSRGDII
jgi:hypothetical protein